MFALGKNQNLDISRNPEIPEDRALAGFPDLFKPDTILDIVKNRFEGIFSGATDCHIEYIRYKPSTNCIISYRIKKQEVERLEHISLYAKLYTKNDYDDAVEKAANHRWIPIEGIDPYITIPDYHAIVYFFPNDCLIDGLRVLSTPKKIQRILYEHYGDFPEADWRISDSKLKISLARYKPERRAVLRCDTKAVNRQSGERVPLGVYLRIYGDKLGMQVFEIQKALYDKTINSDLLRVPRPIAYLDERNLLVMETVFGEQLLDNLKGIDRIDWIKRTAAALASLHKIETAGLPSKSAQDYLEEAGATRETLAEIMPESNKAISEVFDFLNDNSIDKSGSGTVHGDFYYSQVLCGEKAVSILDFDRSHAGDVVYDIGNFLAHIRFMTINGELEGDSNIESAFLSATKMCRRPEYQMTACGTGKFLVFFNCR